MGCYSYSYVGFLLSGDKGEKKMSGSLMSVVNAWKKEEALHICYLYNTQEYIETIVTFIVSGIRKNELVLVVENERNMFQIKQEISEQLSDEQLVNVHFINNFDFYWSNGDFHPQTIFRYFTELIDPFLKSGTLVRTWANIEWGDVEEVNDKIEELEKIADNVVQGKNKLSICAYNARKIPHTWKPILANSHCMIITEKD